MALDCPGLGRTLCPGWPRIIPLISAHERHPCRIGRGWACLHRGTIAGRPGQSAPAAGWPNSPGSGWSIESAVRRPLPPLALGTETVRRVDKITGPGNAYVISAKRQLFGAVGIDMIAGPSEVVIIAESGSNPAWIAADLLAQAEHDQDAQSILITTCAEVADGTDKEIRRQLACLERARIASESWDRHGALIIVRDLQEAVDISDRIAPEHLPSAWQIRRLSRIQSRTPERFSWANGVPRSSVTMSRDPTTCCPPTVLQVLFGSFSIGFHEAHIHNRDGPRGVTKIGPAAAVLARAEGLTGHGAAIRCRLDRHPGNGHRQ